MTDPSGRTRADEDHDERDRAAWEHDVERAAAAICAGTGLVDVEVEVGPTDRAHVWIADVGPHEVLATMEAAREIIGGPKATTTERMQAAEALRVVARGQALAECRQVLPVEVLSAGALERRRREREEHAW